MQRQLETITETTIGMTIEMTTLEKVEVGLGKDNTHVTLEGMTEAVVDPDIVQEPVQTKTGLDVTNVENMTISLITFLTHILKENQSKYNNCLTWTRIKLHYNF